MNVRTNCSIQGCVLDADHLGKCIDDYGNEYLRASSSPLLADIRRIVREELTEVLKQIEDRLNK